ncbi:MAG: alpha/beta hydrolase [Longimicrobiales bacterium]
MRACDVELHVARAGEGPAVILLHGFPENWTSWRHQIPALVAAGYSVLAPDMRGYNLSDRPAMVEDYKLRLLIDDIAELVRATPNKRAYIVGHDWGGVIAWTFAGAYPELVEKLVIMNAPHMYLYRKLLRSPEQLRRSWYVALFRIPHLAETLLRFNDYRAIRRTFANGPARAGTFSDADIDAYVDALRPDGALTAMLNYYRAMSVPGSMDIARQARVECDTLVIWGDLDPALSLRLLVDLDEVAPLVQLERIPTAGHWVQNEAPEDVNRLMLAFLKAPPSPPKDRPVFSPILPLHATRIFKGRKHLLQ